MIFTIKTIKTLINTAFIVSSLQVVNQASVNSAQHREQFFGIQVTSVGQVLTPTRLEARSSSLRN